jgi:glyoxylase-like metal-dependent hydrolase (beta-lactamase superfamily II)
MTQLAPGVLRIATSRGDRDNAYLIEEEDGYTLVDVGWQRAPAAIMARLAQLGRQPTDIKRIALTHAHPDHVRGLAELARRSGAQVLIHQDDAPWLEAGRVPAAGRSGQLGRAIDTLPLLHWTPIRPDILLGDDDTVASLRVIPTPGHSPGHIAFLHEPTRALLVGDAVFNRTGLAVGPDALAADPAGRNASLGRLAGHATVVGFAHGAPLQGSQVDAFNQFCQHMERTP